MNSTTSLNESKWGIDPDNPLPEGVSEILELDGVEDEGQF